MPLEFREVAIPRVREREILVEVIACTLCGSDLHSLSGRRSVPTPTILGHEALGRIVEFGPETPRFDAAGVPLAPGDRVTWGVVASCGECFTCKRRLSQKCERQTKYGHERLHPGRELSGGLAGHCLLVAGTAVFAVSEVLCDAAACPANCATATVAAALEAAGPGQLEGSRVLVMGSGLLGLTAAAWARSLGASRVMVCDPDADRRALAGSFGATEALAPESVAEAVLGGTEGHGVDVVFEMSGAPEAIESSLSLLRLGGTLVLVGSVFPTRAVPVIPEQVVRRCLKLQGIHNYQPHHLQAALRFLAGHPSYPFSTLVTDWRPLSELAEVLQAPPMPGKARIGIRPFPAR